MPNPTLRCRTCGHVYHVVRVKPRICPGCDTLADWITDPVATMPKRKPLDFTVNDKRFLRSLRIAVDDEPGRA